MALKNPSLFLFGFQVSPQNQSLDFLALSGGPILMATLTIGYYDLTGLCEEIARAMQAADPANVYTATVDRTVSGGRENRVTIATSGTFLSLLFGSGPRAPSACQGLIGFPATDQTGATSYQGGASAGTALVPNYVGYNYIAPPRSQKVFGSLNVSASGQKESIVFSVQSFWRVQFKYINEAGSGPAGNDTAAWEALLNWMIQQRSIEFTPDITTPGTFFEGTLESTVKDSSGLSFELTEMIPEMPGLYDTGLLTFRQRLITPTFI